MEPNKKFIALRLDTYAVTAEEYEVLLNEISVSHAVGDITLADQILAKILHMALYRYNEVKAHEAKQQAA